MTYSHYPLLAAFSLLLLSACGVTKSADLQSHLENPLFAEQYYDAQVDNMVNLLVGSGELLKDAGVKKAIDTARVEGLRLAKEATDMQNKGKIGAIASDTEEVKGEILLLDGVLYTGPDFRMWPGADIHLYLSTVVDPRDGAFPDATAIDIDSIHTPFGASTYDVSAALKENKELRTAVFYDKTLKRMVGFAQL